MTCSVRQSCQESGAVPYTVDYMQLVESIDKQTKGYPSNYCGYLQVGDGEGV
jgi:hypothetical protein